MGEAFTLASNSAPGAGRRTVTGQGEEPRKDGKPRQPPPRPSKPPARRAPPGQALARTCQRSARPPAASNPLTLTLTPIRAFTARSAPTTHRFADAKRSQRPPYRFGRSPRKGKGRHWPPALAEGLRQRTDRDSDGADASDEVVGSLAGDLAGLGLEFFGFGLDARHLGGQLLQFKDFAG